MFKYNIDNKGENLIVFINGAGVGPWMWENQIKYFKDYKCITFDLPGHGQNNSIDFYSIKECAYFIKEIISKEAIAQKAIVIGHSIGSQILMYMLDHYEEVIKKAVLISGLNNPMPAFNSIIKPMVALSMPLAKSKTFAKIQAKQLAIPDYMFSRYYKDSLKISKKSFNNILHENSNFEYKNYMNSKVETLILVGEKEKDIMLKSAIINLRLLKNSQGFILLDASHGIPYEKADILNYALDNFLNSALIDNGDLIRIKKKNKTKD